MFYLSSITSQILTALYEYLPFTVTKLILIHYLFTVNESRVESLILGVFVLMRQATIRVIHGVHVYGGSGIDVTLSYVLNITHGLWCVARDVFPPWPVLVVYVQHNNNVIKLFFINGVCRKALNCTQYSAVLGQYANIYELPYFEVTVLSVRHQTG